MIEGTSNPFGSIWCANVARKKMDDQKQASGNQGQWNLETLVFSTNFRLGFDVEDFQTILPKNLIHHMVPGEEIHDFFEAWKRSAKETTAMKTYGAKRWFVAAAESLAQKGYKINLQKKFLSRGYMIWGNG
jgi:hypothetical protein